MAVGDRWKVRDAAAKVMSGYDTITSNNLEATLESADADKARHPLERAGRGLGFRRHGRDRLRGIRDLRPRSRPARPPRSRTAWKRARPGPVEAGLDMKSTLTVARHPAEPPEALSDAALADVPLGYSRESELLQITLPGGRATLLADRNWHIFWEDSRTAILKRLDGGRVIAQCNLMVGPRPARAATRTPASSATTFAAA